MRKTVLIVEDDNDQLNMLRQLVLAVNQNVEVYIADNAAQAYRFFTEKTVDVFLVDIMLDTTNPRDISGVRLVERFRQIPRYMFTPVIFVTSVLDSNSYAYKGLNCISYIEKPYDPEQVMRTVEKALNYTTVREKDVTFSFRKDGILYPVKLKDIVYMESLRHIMYIQLANGMVLDILYKTCKGILKEEDSAESLVQCSRGVLVNREYVKRIDSVNDLVVLKEGFGVVNIGRKYKKGLLSEFSDLT